MHDFSFSIRGLVPANNLAVSLRVNGARDVAVSFVTPSFRRKTTPDSEWNMTVSGTMPLHRLAAIIGLADPDDIIGVSTYRSLSEVK